MRSTQSLEAYYQEAGRAGRDGLLSMCTLYCDMTTLPSLLPSRRNPEQTWHALSMLEHCYRYGLSTSKCRAGILLNYFGEDISDSCCKICDVCTTGPPALDNLTKEAETLLTILSEYKGATNLSMSIGVVSNRRKRPANRNHFEQSFQHAVDKITESTEVSQKNQLWWRGFGRILADAGFLKEANNLTERHGRNLTVPHLKNPEVTLQGFEFLEKCKVADFKHLILCICEERKKSSPPLCVHPEGDMIQALKSNFASATSWGRGWADPEIRRQRISRFRAHRSKGSRSQRHRSKSKGGALRRRLRKEIGH